MSRMNEGMMTRNMMAMGNRTWPRKNIAPSTPAMIVKRRLDSADK
jgi:hypothetical protein